MVTGRVLGIDIGGTKVAVGIVDLSSMQVITSLRADAPAQQGGSAVYQTAVALCRQLPELAQVQAIGVCYGGQVLDNHVLRSNQVHGWDDFPLEKRLQADLGMLPVRIFNDANAIAWLEWTQRAGRGLQSLFYVTVSTGIGGGLVLNGQIHEGRHGLSAEIGHTMLEPDGVRCVCGRHGCLEALAAGPAISRAYAALTGEALPAKEVAERATKSDEAAAHVLREGGARVGRALAIMNVLLDVDCVVLGGGVSRSGALWWDAVLERLHADTPDWGTAPSVEASTFGELEGVLAGAAIWLVG